MRPGRMGRHIWFRTPTKDDRQDIFDLYLGKVATTPELDRPRAPRRAGAHHERLLPGDDRAGLLDGADLRALRRPRGVRAERPRRGDDDDRVGHRDRRRATSRTRRARSRSTRPATRSPATSTCPTCSRRACRSACAAARSATTRRSRRRSASRAGATRRSASSSGRSARWPPSTSSTARTPTGVGGDVQSADLARGADGRRVRHGPRADRPHAAASPSERKREVEQELMERFERIGLQIMNRPAAGSRWTGDPIGAVLGDRAKRRAAAQILGQAYITAVCCMRHNREAVARSPRRSWSAASSTATRSSSCSTPPASRRPRSTSSTRRSGRSCEREPTTTPTTSDAAAPGPGRHRSPSTTPALAAAPSARRARCCRPSAEALVEPTRRARPASDLAAPSAAARPPASGRSPPARGAPPPTRRASSSSTARSSAVGSPRSSAVDRGRRRHRRRHDDQRGRWSAWQPHRERRRRRAADRRPRRAARTADDGKQLVQVAASGIDLEGIPLTVALREPPAHGGDIQVFDGKGVLYRLCGLGADCAIEHGQAVRRAPPAAAPRGARARALHVPLPRDVEQVVVLIPPAPARPSLALFFRREDCAPSSTAR